MIPIRVLIVDGSAVARAALSAAARPNRSGRVILVGSPTGGPDALGVALRALPAKSPGLTIVQPMPERITASLARRLDSRCAATVKEQAGAPTIAQGESTRVVFGMPHEAIKLGTAGRAVSIDRIAPAILEACR